MIRFSLDSLKSGMKLGKSIYNEDATLLLGRGVVITEWFINKLSDKGINSIFIHDDATEDVDPPENISEMVRGATIRHMRDLFGAVDDIKSQMKDISIGAVQKAVSSDQFKKTFRDHPAFQTLQGDVENIVSQLIEGDVTIGLNSLKTYDNYTFQHSIDVSIVSIMIAKKLALPEKKLHELGMGCLLHDMGKVFIPAKIVNKPGKLTDEEFKVVQAHPMIGFELTRGTTSIGMMPPHIALQHHEKQDGTGYPRGLKGTNKLNSSGTRIIHFYADIAAVADVYDALSSDRPYRDAMPPEKVIDILRKMSGSHLNREVLNVFLGITPVFPIGSTVRIVTEGKYQHHIGVVTQLNKNNMERPFIRLLFNGLKRKIKPVDINLLEQKDMQILSFVL